MRVRDLEGILQEPPQPACTSLDTLFRPTRYTRLECYLNYLLSTWQAARRRVSPRDPNAQSFLLSLHTLMPLQPFPLPAYNP